MASAAASSGVWKSGPSIDVEAEIGEGRGDDLLAAVVAVLADLGDEDPRRPPVVARQSRAASCRAAATAARRRRPRRHRRRLTASASAGGGRRPAPAPRSFRRRWPGRGPHRRQAPADCRRRSRAARSARSSAARRGARRARRCSRSSFSIWAARTAELSTFRTSIGGSSVGRIAVDADHRLPAGIDPRLGARRRLLDPQLRNAGLDRLGHAAERVDLGDMVERARREVVRSAARRR